MPERARSHLWRVALTSCFSIFFSACPLAFLSMMADLGELEGYFVVVLDVRVGGTYASDCLIASFTSKWSN